MPKSRSIKRSRVSGSTSTIVSTIASEAGRALRHELLRSGIKNLKHHAWSAAQKGAQMLGLGTPNSSPYHRRARQQANPGPMEVIRGSITESSDVINLKGHYKHKTVGFWKLSDNIWGEVDATAGSQGVSIIGAAGCYKQILNGNGPVSAYNGYCSYFDGNPYQMGTNQSSRGATAVVTPKDDEIIWKTCHFKYNFSNASVNAVHLDLYVLQARMALPSTVDPATSWNEGYIDTAENAATGVVPNKNSAVPAVASYPAYNFLYQTPKDSKTFKKQYKILKHKVVKMEGGADMEWNLHIILNKKLMRNKVLGYNLLSSNTVRTSDPVTFIPGSILIMAVVRGAKVVKDTVASASSNYTTATCGVNYVGRIDNKFNGVPDQANRLRFVEAYQLIDSGAPNANQISFIDTTQGTATQANPGVN